MKTVLILTLLAGFACSLPVDQRENGENGWYVPLVDGGTYWVDKDEGNNVLSNMAENIENGILGLLANESNPVKLFLLSPNNPTDFQEIEGTIESIENSHYDPTLPVKFSVHGWTQSYNSTMNLRIADAWLKKGDYNIIVPDWSRARDPNYFASVAAVSGVGKKLATFIDFLVTNFGLEYNTLELIGHSLGAHVCGFAGKNVQLGKVNTIVALDAALPLFHLNEPTKRLCVTDANYVQAIHTCGGRLGFLKPIGTSDFYPNGGQNQPGCAFDITGACDHGRSCLYYEEAIANDDFSSTKCANYEDAVADKCTSKITTLMGAILNKYKVSGAYYVPVHSTSPYGTLASK